MYSVAYMYAYICFTVCINIHPLVILGGSRVKCGHISFASVVTN